MSEIRSISEGSFVIGDTNNLTFEAGTGIKVDSPSEGTVRIANDETVLWETTSNVTSATLSESYKNFEYVKFFLRDNDNECVSKEIDTSVHTNTIITFISNTVSTEPKSYFRTCTYNISSTSMSYRSGISYAISPNSTALTNLGTNPNMYIKKVIGINRISNT